SFYESTKQSLWRYVAGILRDDALAKDILQDAYTRFLQSGDEVREPAQMKSYLFQIATNLMRDHWRKLKNQRNWFDEETASAQSSTDGSRMELRHDFRRAFEFLSPQQRSLVWLAYAEGYAHKEIAAMLNVREKSVKVLLFRAKQRLLEICSQLGISMENSL
ncbi:MAG TPA: RNA polymerase sigma factor, partial [Bacteroidota bacterium]|nr:RNA polymerase sigma factor [Bacteroidota bacterium]